MALSSGPAGGLAGDLHPFQNRCSLREVESNVDPASYEHFIETLRQGSAGALRVAASARLLQREAHKTSTFAKAALGAATSILDHPDGTPGMLAKRETQRYAIAWWNRYFKDLAESEPKRIRARRSMADAKAQKEDLESKLAQLQSINKYEFRKRLSDQQQDLKAREADLNANTQSNLQMKMELAEATGNKMEAAKYRDKLDDYWVKREKEEASLQEIKEDLAKQQTFINKLPGELKSTESKAKSAAKRFDRAAVERLGKIRGHLDDDDDDVHVGLQVLSAADTRHPGQRRPTKQPCVSQDELQMNLPLKPTNPYEKLPRANCYRLGRTPAEASMASPVEFWMLTTMPRFLQRRSGDFL